jgi:hypothetical protein
LLPKTPKPQLRLFIENRKNNEYIILVILVPDKYLKLPIFHQGPVIKYSLETSQVSRKDLKCLLEKYHCCVIAATDSLAVIEAGEEEAVELAS